MGISHNIFDIPFNWLEQIRIRGMYVEYLDMKYDFTNTINYIKRINRTTEIFYLIYTVQVLFNAS